MKNRFLFRSVLLGCVVLQGSIGLCRAASRVFYDGFEDGTTSKWTSGNASVSGIMPHGGLYCARGNWNGLVEWNDPAATEGFFLGIWPYSQEFLVRFWLRQDSDKDPTAGAKYLRLPFGGDKSGNEIILSDSGGGSMHTFASVNGNSVRSIWGCADFSDNLWHKVEIYIKDATNGMIQIWIDDQALTCNSSNGDTWPFVGNTHLNSAGWNQFYWMSNWSNNPGWEHDANNHMYLDNVEIFSDVETGAPAAGGLSDATITVGGGGGAPPAPPRNLRLR